VRVKPDGRTGWKRHDRAAWVEQQLGRPGVKAFNNIYTERFYELGQPPGSPGCIAYQSRMTTQQKRLCYETAALIERRYNNRHTFIQRLPLGSHSKEGVSNNSSVASQNPTHAH
jgi:hypothetical protein